MKIAKTTHLEGLAQTLFAAAKSEDEWRLKTRSLSKAITLVENDPKSSGELLKLSTPFGVKNKCHVIGITGLPGAGKSSLTSHLISKLKNDGKKVAVFAVDPSSTETGGAFLGDRVRMSAHYRDANVFIRSMASRGALGGLARATRGAIQLAAFAGFDFVLVETVGIGQSESAIIDVADTVVLVLMPHSGDEVQLLKAGVLERCHIYVVNKSDLADASRMLQEISENTEPSPASKNWRPRVLATSAKNNAGLAELQQAIFDHGTFLGTALAEEREQRIKKAVKDEALFLIEDELEHLLSQLPETDLKALLDGKQAPFNVAAELVKTLFEGKRT